MAWQCKVSTLCPSDQRLLHRQSSTRVGGFAACIGTPGRIENEAIAEAKDDTETKGDADTKGDTEAQSNTEAQNQQVADRNTLEDHWALEHLMPRQLQCIIDAIDCDASGFITVSEANTFTRALPEAWRYVSMARLSKSLNVSCGFSMLRWLAYWAVGEIPDAQNIIKADSTT